MVNVDKRAFSFNLSHVLSKIVIVAIKSFMGNLI